MSEQETWRLIIDEKASGPFNMAADQYLLQQASSRKSPTLRIYTWNPLTLSVGRNQKLDEELNLGWLQENPLPIIRRATGGKAVLHGNDLTYSVVGQTGDARFSGGILSTYQNLSQCFVHFFKTLGLAPEVHELTKRPDQASHVCFSVPSSFEILISGRKIIGSAQRQTSEAFLQHGTIALTDQISLFENLFKNASSEKLQEEMTSLETENIIKSIADLQHHLVRAFEETFQIALEMKPWSFEEQSAIAELEDTFEIVG